jgi:hypothetical protein
VNEAMFQTTLRRGRAFEGMFFTFPTVLFFDMLQEENISIYFFKEKQMEK